MTLVVAAIHGDEISMVADTKITFEEDKIRSARLFEEAMPKIVLLRDDVAVGISGSAPRRVVEDLLALRDQALDSITEHLRGEELGGFVVGSLGPPQLWQVGDGTIELRREGEKAWVGDRVAFSRLQELYAAWPGSESVLFRLASSMDQLVSPLGPTSTVGGYALSATSANGKFHFLPNSATIFPRMDLGDVRFEGSTLIATGSADFGSGAGPYRIRILAGFGDTPGAVGIFVLDAKAGMLFSQERAFEGIKILSDSPEGFIQIALDSHQQRIR